MLEQLDEQHRVGPGQDQLRSLGVLIDLPDHSPDPVTGRIVLRARLLPSREERFDASGLDDDVAVFETLDRPRHHFAESVAELVVDVVALRFPHLLEDHLLGGLGGDPTQHISRFRELDLHVDFRFVAVELLCLGEGDLGRRVSHVLYDLPDRVEIDLTRVGIELGPEVFVRLVVFPRRGQHGILDRRDDDVRIDPFFLGQGLDRLQQGIVQCHCLSSALWRSQNSTSSLARKTLDQGIRCTRRPASITTSSASLSTAVMRPAM